VSQTPCLVKISNVGGYPYAPVMSETLIGYARATRLTVPDGSLIYGGECGQPRPWRVLITRTGRCAVLIVAIGLHANPGERAPTRITTLLDQAAHAGELVGGLVEAS
jgi:hypothetical protein